MEGPTPLEDMGPFTLKVLGASMLAGSVDKMFGCFFGHSPLGVRIPA